MYFMEQQMFRISTFIPVMYSLIALEVLYDAALIFKSSLPGNEESLFNYTYLLMCQPKIGFLLINFENITIIRSSFWFDNTDFMRNGSRHLQILMRNSYSFDLSLLSNFEMKKP